MVLTSFLARNRPAGGPVLIVAALAVAPVSSVPILGIVLGIVTAAPAAAQAQSAADKASSKPMKLLKLTVTGNKQVSTDAIDQGMTVKVGDKVTKSDLEANLNAIVDIYRKANVGAGFKAKMTIPRPGQVTIAYMITEQPPQAPQAPAVLQDDKVTFEGNKQVTSDAIQAVITIKPGDTVTSDKVVANMQAIVALYKKAGIGTKVTPSATYPQPNHVVVDYKIEEQAAAN